jgi:hypothetical protein
MSQAMCLRPDIPRKFRAFCFPRVNAGARAALRGTDMNEIPNPDMRALRAEETF